jgi:hypothetical protein
MTRLDTGRGSFPVSAPTIDAPCCAEYHIVVIGNNE